MSNGSSKGTSTSSAFHLVAGLGSGFTSAILLQPADLLKTRVQQSGSRSLLLTLKEIVRQPNPLRELWRGTLPSVIRTSCGSALYFSTLTRMRRELAKSQNAVAGSSGGSSSSSSSSALPKLSAGANLLTGAVARASVGFVLMPMTVLKVRYESSMYQYTSIRAAFSDMLRREGLRGFFAGFGATALRDAPYAGLYVLLYEQGKKVLNQAVSTTVIPSSSLVSPTPAAAAAASVTGGDAAPIAATAAGGTVALGPPTTSGRFVVTDSSGKQMPAPSPLKYGVPMAMPQSAAINFASSAVAASGATLLTNPPDAIKTRLQLQPARYKNTLQALKLMLREEGPRSLFDGLGLRMARKALSSALAWTVYEEALRWAEHRLS